MENKEVLTKKLRSDVNRFACGLSPLPNPDKILMKAGGSLSAYRDLKNDPHVWSCIQSRKSGLLSLKYEIVEKDGGKTQLKDEITEVIENIDIYELMRDILEAPLFGWQPIELIWQIGTAKSGENKLIPTATVARPHEWFAYRADGRLCVKSENGNLSNINEMKILCPRFEATPDNPYGHSLLSKCYWAVIFKNSAMQNWTKFCEKYGMPILIGQYTRGCTRDESERLAAALSEMSEDSVIVAPADINIKLNEASKTSSSELYRDLIKYCNAEISKAILSQTLTTELDMGSYAATQTHYKIRREVIMADMQIVERTINQLIKFYVDINFGKQANYPKFKLIMEE